MQHGRRRETGQARQRSDAMRLGREKESADEGRGVVGGEWCAESKPDETRRGRGAQAAR